jgi:hypothetical protein
MTPTSGIEFLVWLLIAAAIIAMPARPASPCRASLWVHHFRHGPYFCTGDFQRPEGEQAAIHHQLFGILSGAVVAEKFSLSRGVGQYFLAVVGGAVLGSALGYLASRVTQSVHDPEVEITLTTILAYGSYLLAYHLEVSGVIATASAGLVLGNFGAKKGALVSALQNAAKAAKSWRSQTAMVFL